MTQATPVAARAGKYLTFGLGEEDYGLEILKVREIMGLLDITSVPNTPHYIKGGREHPRQGHCHRRFAKQIRDDGDEDHG